MATVVYQTSTTCNGQTYTGGDAVSGVCNSINLIHGMAGERPLGLLLSQGPPTGGSCAPTQNGSETIPTASFSNASRVCGSSLQGGGCGAGACVPRPQTPFDSKLCVYQLGDVASCPTAFSQRTLYYRGFDDTRACSACTCNAPSGSTCNGTVRDYTGVGCTTDETIASANSCTPITVDSTTLPPDMMNPTERDTRTYRYNAGTASGGSCQASGGAPVGAATVRDPVTVCCIP